MSTFLLWNKGSNSNRRYPVSENFLMELSEYFFRKMYSTEETFPSQVSRHQRLKRKYLKNLTWIWNPILQVFKIYAKFWDTLTLFMLMKKKSSGDECRIYPKLGRGGKIRNVSKIFFHCECDLLHVLTHGSKNLLKKHILKKKLKCWNPKLLSFLHYRWQDILERHSMTINERLPCEKPDQLKALKV